MQDFARLLIDEFYDTFYKSGIPISENTYKLERRTSQIASAVSDILILDLMEYSM